MLNTLTSNIPTEENLLFQLGILLQCEKIKRTLPDSTMTDAELSEPQDKITSQENDGSILNGTISESVEGNRTNSIHQTTDPRNSPFIRRSSRPRRTPAYLEDYEHH
ncbi:hypothetical protein HHI36_004268 [Cryptolaemus montrouzieri]|uniref:Uncharacterized protein n=1 Tax=Cryptolaemus montrouzieri TaxID=559131 RepID=A0ABD2NR26_9CUCU